MRFSVVSLREWLGNLRNRDASIVLALVVALVFTNNVFHYSQYRINQVFDQTSEGLVVGRLARSASDGLFSERAELGNNYREKDSVELRGSYSDQIKYFEQPELIKADGAQWAVYPSQFGLQGIFYALIDSIDPLPRRVRIGFYHFLSALICAAAFMWVATKIRERFGFAAATGFVVPVAFEPMFTALAPNLYWAVGLWFVPMAIAMDIADAQTRRRRRWLIVATGAAVFAKSLCGYEFISTVIVAPMIGCLLNTRDDKGYPFQNIIDMLWVAVSGVIGFALAVLVHGAKLGFAVIFDRAMERTSGAGASTPGGLDVGQFASISSVIRIYLGANDFTLIRSFALVVCLLGAIAAAAFLDREYGWFLGEERRKLRTLAFAFLASLAAPLSWFILAKAHAFAHQPIDFILWFVPTLPVAGAMTMVALGQAFAARGEWSASFKRSFLTLAIPTFVLLTVAFVALADRRIEKAGSWVVEAHANGMPVFADKDIGVDLRMSDKWFTFEYACDRASPTDIFFIRANGGQDQNYEFRLWQRAIAVPGKHNCYYAQQRTDGAVSRLEFGLRKGSHIVWQREASVAAAP